MDTGHKRSGFTLVELLVCLAIVGVLTAVAVPAVQSAREAARRAQCQNNLKQISTAVLDFEESRQRLPAGRDARSDRHHSWATTVLPYLDQSPLFQRYNFSVGWNDPSNRLVVDTNLAVFRCPSAVREWTGKSDYGGCYGSTLTGLEPGFSVGRGWEAGTLLVVGMPFAGFRQSVATMADLIDGASQTFLVLEDSDRLPDEGGRWADGHNCFAHDDGPINHKISGEIFSQHPGGAHGSLADGSVRFFSASMDLSVLGALCTRAAGEVINH